MIRSWEKGERERTLTDQNWEKMRRPYCHPSIGGFRVCPCQCSTIPHMAEAEVNKDLSTPYKKSLSRYKFCSLAVQRMIAEK